MPTADKRIPVSEATKDLIDERKPDGVTYDALLRKWSQTAPPVLDQ